MNLAAFMAEAARTPFAWGQRDCCLWMADWLVALGRPDPATHLRGRYSTARGCARVLSRGGGLEAVVRACAERAGLSETDLAVAGDVGVVRIETPNGPALSGAICLGRRWAVLGLEGVIAAETTPLAAWRI